MSDFLSCSYTSICSGCDWLLKPLHEQASLKNSHFKAAWSKAFGESRAFPNIRWISTQSGASRDRVDLMIDQRSGSKSLGLFDKLKTGIVDLQGCPQLSHGLEQWLRDFRKVHIPVLRGSIRLRVSPQGKRGVWLDLANIDVKNLLEERSTLDQLRSMAIVEIGQRRKRLVEKDGVLKLGDPLLESWFETYTEKMAQETSVPLYCAIGSFTQPGFAVNRVLVRETIRQIKSVSANRALEFGSGIGNFTLPLAEICSETHAFEVDEMALEGLRRSLLESGLSSKVTIHSGNYQIARKDPADFRGFDLVLVDPPRSGLLKFIDPLFELPIEERPRNFIYVSCFTESFISDLERLFSMGYSLTDISLVDQFPQSRHYEIVASLHRS